MKRMAIAWLCATLVLLAGCRTAASPTTPAPEPEAVGFIKARWIPYMDMETLYGAGDVGAVQQAIETVLEEAVQYGLNTVYVHVRANSDAYYDSTVFAPTASTAALLSQGFDPFAYIVDVGHELGLTVHAWVNPYRIGTDKTRARLEDIFEVNGRWYYAPTSAAVQRLVVDGVRELVQHYAVDGVQFDDYFYPEGAVDALTPAPFEEEAFAAASMPIGDFRRAQVSQLVAAVYAVCHAREDCVFGISPSYDIARNTDRLYADVALWASTAGYVDYLCPQLYVGFANEYAPFESALAAWDVLERDTSVALIGGLALYKTGLADDAYAGAGRAEWAQGGDILARQVQAVQAASWDGVALYGDALPDADSGRDTAVAARESEALTALLRDINE